MRVLDVGMKVLVTGATGYIGAHVVKALNRVGVKPDCIDIDIENRNNIDQYCNKLLEYDVTERLWYEHYDVIIHLAGSIS